MDTSKRIFLVDDEEAIRHSASFMLRHAGFTVKTFADGPSFLAELRTGLEGCVLLDVRMPEMDGLTVLGHIRSSEARLPVIILTGHGDISTAVEAMKLGATDFLEKPYEKNALLTAIEHAFAQVEAGDHQLNRKAAAKAKIDQLTGRERDVLALLVDGMTNKAIANELSISSRTVEIHRANLMAKLDADSLSAALKTAFSAGMGLEGD